MTSAEMREQLADLEHQRWAGWQRYLHSRCIKLPEGGLVIPAEFVRRWERQMDTHYKDLSEKEKQSDREQVDRYLPLLLAAIAERDAEIERLKAVLAKIRDNPDNLTMGGLRYCALSVLEAK